MPMPFIVKYAIGMVLLIASTADCSNMGEKQPKIISTQQTDSEAESLNEASNLFALSIFDQIRESKNVNYFFSPYSIHQALLMAMNGNEGEILEEFRLVLKVKGFALDDLNNNNLELSGLLQKADPKVTFNIANSIWYREGLSLQSGFQKTIETNYQAYAKSLDMASPQAAGTINRWIEEKTQGMIKDMIKDVSPEAVMFLVNAIYFKGDWEFPFDPNQTRKVPFYLENGQEIKVDMMMSKSKAKLNSYRDGQMQYLEIPYGSGTYSMGVVFQREGNISELESQITLENLNRWKKESYRTDILLQMPKFKMSYRMDDLSSDLKKLGLQKAFEPRKDNFTLLFDQETKEKFISKVIHEAKIEVDEKGTEASAATGIEIGVTSMPEPPQVITLDRPFIFFIREESSGVILFMGKLGNPSML
jgi:serpin B